MTRGRRSAVHVASLVGVCALEISCGGSPSGEPNPNAASLPQALTSVWGSSATDVWAVGEEGTLLHFDGTKWNTLDSGTFQDLYAVSGSGPDDVWAVGDDVIVHYDGSQTEIVMSDMFEVLLGIWVHGKDVWASGLATDYDTGMVRHWDGTKWDFTDTGSAKPLWEIWGSGPTDVWTGGTASDGTTGFLARGKPLRKAPGDGGSFSTIQFDETTYSGDAVRGIWGASSERRVGRGVRRRHPALGRHNLDLLRGPQRESPPAPGRPGEGRLGRRDERHHSSLQRHHVARDACVDDPDAEGRVGCRIG